MKYDEELIEQKLRKLILQEELNYHTQSKRVCTRCERIDYLTLGYGDFSDDFNYYAEGLGEFVLEDNLNGTLTKPLIPFNLYLKVDGDEIEEVKNDTLL